MQNNKTVEAIVQLITNYFFAILSIFLLILTLFILSKDFTKEFVLLILTSWITIFFLDQISKVRENISKNQSTLGQNLEIRKHVERVIYKELSEIKAVEDYKNIDYYGLIGKSLRNQKKIISLIDTAIPMLVDRKLIRVYINHKTISESLLEHMNDLLALYDNKSARPAIDKVIEKIKADIDQILINHSKLIIQLNSLGVY